MTPRRGGPGVRRIGLLGMYASANLGDTAIQQAVMGALRVRHPDVEFVALCTDPEDAALTLGLHAHHLSGIGAEASPSGGAGVSIARHWLPARAPSHKPNY